MPSRWLQLDFARRRLSTVRLPGRRPGERRVPSAPSIKHRSSTAAARNPLRASIPRISRDRVSIDCAAATYFRIFSSVSPPPGSLHLRPARESQRHGPSGDLRPKFFDLGAIFSALSSVRLLATRNCGAAGTGVKYKLLQPPADTPPLFARRLKGMFRSKAHENR